MTTGVDPGTVDVYTGRTGSTPTGTAVIAESAIARSQISDFRETKIGAFGYAYGFANESKAHDAKSEGARRGTDGRDHDQRATAPARGSGSGHQGGGHTNERIGLMDRPGSKRRRATRNERAGAWST